MGRFGDHPTSRSGDGHAKTHLRFRCWSAHNLNVVRGHRREGAKIGYSSTTAEPLNDPAMAEVSGFQLMEMQLKHSNSGEPDALDTIEAPLGRSHHNLYPLFAPAESPMLHYWRIIVKR